MSEFVATIHVRPKSEVRDPQGEAVAGALRALGFEIADVRTGKEIVVRFDARDEAKALEATRTMGDQLLANPVIEDFAIELAGPPQEAVHVHGPARVRDLPPVPKDQPNRITWLRHTPRSSSGVIQLNEIRAHIHVEHDEILHVIEGTAQFRIADRVVAVNAGETVVVPAGIVHGIPSASEGAVLTTVFAPRFDPDRPDRVFVE